MIVIKYKQYVIEIHNEQNYILNSLNNPFQYHIFYNTQNEDIFQPSTKHGIRIYEKDVCIKSVLLLANGGATAIHAQAAIINQNKLLICCSDYIFCLELANLKLVWKTKADDATCFEIFNFNNNYIIHGEMKITMLDKNGKIEWSVSGADIFTTPSGESDFEIRKDYIYARDWNKNEYWINFDGKVIYDTIKKI